MREGLIIDSKVTTLATKGYIHSRLSRCFTARGFSTRDPTKGIRLVSSKVTKLPPKI